MSQKSISFRAQASSTIRTEMYLGREHIVVPVVALVEGVLQGLSSPTPEYAAASEFGKVPEGWNGRPVVMNHPIINGTPVSANSPTVLETYAFGQLFNTYVEDGKLLTEAWIDTERVNTLGGEVSTTVERIQSGTIVEVSTGLFTDIEHTSGRFNGKDYAAVWHNIVPDHLAFLSDGVKGACSVADGCGTPRVNATEPTEAWSEYVLSASSGCTCGGSGSGTPSQNADHASTNNSAPPEPTELAVLTRLLFHSVPDNLMDRDLRMLLSQSLRAEFKLLNPGKYGYVYVVGFTTSKVVYETYTYESDMEEYVTLQRSYSVTNTRDVVLGNDIEMVNLLTEIVPISKVVLNSTGQANGEITMADNSATTAGAPVGHSATTTPAVTTPTPATPTTPTTNVSPANEAAVQSFNSAVNVASTPAEPRVRTMAEYLGEMPEEMREVFQSGLKLHAEKKTNLITQLKASGRCKFSDEQLSGMPVDMLAVL